MPRNLQLLRIFLASPTDVQPERTRLEKVIREINLSLANQALQLELVRWETHAYPEFAQDPQTVINNQIGTDYDIFIGVLWSRVGTPTPRSQSGTLEEFHTAYQKWKATPDSMDLMIYFKDEAVPPSKLDPAQLAEVHRFKEGLGTAGGLYWTFQTTDDFETQIRLHLMRLLQSRRDSHGAELAAPTSGLQSMGPTADCSAEPPLVGAKTFLDEEGDLGFLDYMDLVNEAGSRHAAILQRMIDAMESVGNNARARTVELDSLKKSPSLFAARQIFDQTARDLNEFSTTTESEIPQLSQALADLLRYTVGGVASYLGMNATTPDQSEEVLRQMRALTDVITLTRTQMAVFRGTISSLPRMTATLNKAKRRVLQTMDALDAAFSEATEKTSSVHGEIAQLLQRQAAADAV